jgi:hypothetical protein
MSLCFSRLLNPCLYSAMNLASSSLRLWILCGRILSLVLNQALFQITIIILYRVNVLLVFMNCTLFGSMCFPFVPPNEMTSVTSCYYDSLSLLFSYAQENLYSIHDPPCPFHRKMVRSCWYGSTTHILIFLLTVSLMHLPHTDFLYPMYQISCQYCIACVIIHWICPSLSFLLPLCNILKVSGEGLLATHTQPPRWRTTPCHLSVSASSVSSQLHSIAGGHPCIHDLRAHHIVVTRDSPNTD